MNNQFLLQISRHGTKIVLSLLLISSILLFTAGYVYVTPPTQPGSTDTIDEQRFEANIMDSVIVTESNTLWPIGEELTNQEIYFVESSEILLLNGTITVPDDRPVTVRYNYVIKTTVERNGQLLWENSKILDKSEEQSITNGTLYINESVDIVEIIGDSDDINDIVGSSASVSHFVMLKVDYRAEAAMDEQYTGNLEVNRELVTSEDTYSVEDETVAANTEGIINQNEPVTESPDYGIIALLLVVAAATGGSGVVIGLYRRYIPPTSVLNFRMEKASYSERISTGKIEHSPYVLYIELETFDGLVNTAIDHHSRVINDPEKRVYAAYAWPIVFIFFEEQKSTNSDNEAPASAMDSRLDKGANTRKAVPDERSANEPDKT